MPVINRTPYRNLILTGSMGVGKTGIGRLIVQQMKDADFFDLETAIEQREGYSPERIREQFGIARLRSIENEMVHEASLRRSTVMAISGTALLDEANRLRLSETGPVLCLTASLGEILRRLHVTQGGHFHDLNTRAAIIGRLKRERQVLELDIPKLDTTNLKIEEAAKQALEFWMTQSDT